MMETQTQETAADLRQRWEDLEKEQGGIRIRRAARELGVGEAQLLSTKLGDGVTRLDVKAEKIFYALPKIQEVMASTRNANAVIEKHGVYDNIDINPHVGLVLNEAIDLRLFMAHYHSAFVVEKTHRNKPLHSVQFFGRDGTALHKVYAKTEQGRAALAELKEMWRHEDQTSVEPQLPPKEGRTTLPDDEVDVEGFQQSWRALEDTHHFFGMMREYEVGRTQSMRLAPEGYAIKVRNDCVDRLLYRAADQETSIMVFVGSPGCIEIHTGPVKRIVETGGWVNVMDPTFNLHLNRKGVAQSWLVRKPTEDGIVTSLELFDAAGETVAMFFGERKPGIPEDLEWRDTIEDLAGVAPLDA